ncbi:MAG: TonB-dependent receptor [Bacteroidetes bacterium]|nr:TonB-dependent receptor [Bacteroidota bacterium]
MNTIYINAQHIHGVVFEKTDHGEKIFMPGANIYWSGTNQGTTTNADGEFHLDKPEGGNKLLVVSFIGYRNDTLTIADGQSDVEIELTFNNTLKEVVITNKAPGGFISRVEPIYTFHITGAELQKAACCNLSESFETNASVDVTYNDAVTGSKQIRLLGLAGKYSQIQTENIPNLRGLATSFGFGYIPGSWMESIQVSKGTASVKNGYESITGQINIEYKKSNNSEKLFANAYVNHHGKIEGNINSSVKLNDHLSTMILAHAENMSYKTDDNDDTFLDQPLIKQYNVFNRWQYDNNKNIHAKFGIKVLYEDRTGGQTGFYKSEDRTPLNGYGINVKTERYEAFSKSAYIFQKRQATNIAFVNSFIYHFQKSYFGLNDYNARENNYYGNLMFQSYIGNTGHIYTTGISYLMDNYEEYLNDSAFSRKESVPGLFFEYTFIIPEKITLLLGLRADFHNIYGTFFTPRVHFKYNINEKTIFRISAGKGYRTPNIIAENTYILATSRKLTVKEEPKQEEAWNYGFNLTRYFDILGRELALNAEYYRTDFLNQVIVDRDINTLQVVIYNLDGRSFSNSYQLEAAYELIKRLDVTAAFRYNDVRITTNQKLQRQPLVHRYKGLLTFSYATRLKKWQFDITTQLNGDSRIPDTQSNPPEYQRKLKSPVYTILNAQITKYFKSWEVYLGGENLTNYKQENLVIASDDPFGKYFDSSLIWGPITGIKIYMGIRFLIK